MQQIQHEKVDPDKVLDHAETLIKANNLQAAINVIGKIFKDNPNDARGLYLMGLISQINNNLPQTLKFWEASLAQNPKQKELTQKYQDLQKHYLKNLKLITDLQNKFKNEPNSTKLLNQLGDCFIEIKNYDNSLIYFGKSYEIDPENPITCYGLGLSLIQKDRPDEGFILFKKIYDENKTDKLRLGAQLYLFNWLGKYLETNLDYITAKELYFKCINLAKKSYKSFKDFPATAATSYQLLPQMILKIGEASTAVQLNKECINNEVIEDSIYQIFIFLLHFDLNISPQEHLEWAKKCYKFCFPEVDVKAVMQKRFDHLDLDPNKTKLKVGFVSGDFKYHPVFQYISGLFNKFNPEVFEVYCFCNNKEDYRSEKLKAEVKHWLNIQELSDVEVYQFIQQNQIDILVDLSGYTSLARTGLFVLRPCPVQITWLGQSGPFAVPQIQYMLVDNFSFKSEEQINYGEKVYTLPDYLGPYDPEIYEEVSTTELPPCFKNGYITFGSFNQLAKTNDLVFQTWAKVLLAVPNSKLLMKAIYLDQPLVCKKILSIFEKEGIDKERIIFEKPSLIKDYMNSFNQVDLLLDTFPIGGGTTTLNAMFMSVPQIALYGRQNSHRAASSILNCCGLSENIAYSIDEYIEKAVLLANDSQRLKYYKNNIRQKFLSSPITNYNKFAKDFEEVLRKIWKDHHAV